MARENALSLGFEFYELSGVRGITASHPPLSAFPKTLV